MNQSPAQVFSPFVVEALVRAARTRVPASDPTARIKAVEAATEYAKNQHPQLFKKEKS